MDRIKILLLVVTAFVVSASQAQQVKPKFKKLLYVPYYLSLSGKDTVHFIQDRLEVNEQGMGHYTITYYTHPHHTYDTTYQLADTLVAKLNKIFNEKSDLESYRKSDKQDNGFAYKGQLIFISFTDLKGKTHNYIDVRPYMMQEFNAVLKAAIQRARITTEKEFVFDDKVLLSQIIKTQEACSYCEKIEQPSNDPPTVQHLQLADPAIKH